MSDGSCLYPNKRVPITDVSYFKMMPTNSAEDSFSSSRNEIEGGLFQPKATNPKKTRINPVKGKKLSIRKRKKLSKIIKKERKKKLKRAKSSKKLNAVNARTSKKNTRYATFDSMTESSSYDENIRHNQLVKRSTSSRQLHHKIIQNSSSSS